MTFDAESIIVIVIIGGCLLALIALMVWTFIERKVAAKNYDPGEFTPPDPEITQAEVISKKMDTQSYGSYKMPRHRVVYRVAFKTAENEIKEYEVTPDVFDRCELHSKGPLITMNGNFFDFGEGEDIQ